MTAAQRKVFFPMNNNTTPNNPASPITPLKDAPAVGQPVQPQKATPAIDAQPKPAPAVAPTPKI
jgi:hypothetical protein